ncbi:hypothetical protein IAG25_15660 [Caballeronia sp. EK]|uniref:hypothetical protein n=1 Tax=Caballeronia sp. EK TaxID=2767469 RepID=UPI001654FBB3|nr:hypothetical protein [Caballeronia sp. EK]MBC8638258.1 hypothetical protein [Caballeronia sp. EK]
MNARQWKVATRFVLLACIAALGIVTIAAVLTSCTLVYVRGNDISLEQIGGHNGWTLTPATRDTPSLRERIFGQGPFEPKPEVPRQHQPLEREQP